MELHDFTHEFSRLTTAFTVQKPEDKAKVYYEELRRIPFNTFKAAISRLIREADRFPAIATILSTTDAITPKSGLSGVSCSVCNGYGSISLWNHTFRAPCEHGARLNKMIALFPQTDRERQIRFLNLSNEWKKLYGKDFPHSVDDQPIK